MGGQDCIKQMLHVGMPCDISLWHDDSEAFVPSNLILLIHGVGSLDLLACDEFPLLWLTNTLYQLRSPVLLPVDGGEICSSREPAMEAEIDSDVKSVIARVWRWRWMELTKVAWLVRLKKLC